MSKVPVVKIGSYVVHPFRADVPEMDERDLNVLTMWTKERGQRYDIKTDGEGRILDGRAQLRACLAAGIEPKFVVSDLADEPARAVLESMHRKHYTGAQCSLIAEILSQPLAKEARDRQRTAGKPLPKNLGKGEPGEAADIAAKAVGHTNALYVREITRIKKTCPEIIEYIRNGKIPLMAQATKISKMDDGPRKSALKALRAGKDVSLVIERRKKADNEWHTPADICAAVRAAFDGEIACDPCASAKPSNVNATHSYTKKQNGLDLKNDWYDRTFVNPPFSTAKGWVERAISEASSGMVDAAGADVGKPEAEQGKRIYVLLPVRPDSEHQSRLLDVAVDVLLLADRVAFEKPGVEVGPTGRISIMIAGLNCSTMDLIDNGLNGLVVRRVAPRDPDDHLEDLKWLDARRARGNA